MTIQVDAIAGLAVGLVLTGLIGFAAVEHQRVETAAAQIKTAQVQLTDIEAVNQQDAAEIAKYQASAAQVDKASAVLVQQVEANQAATGAAQLKYQAIAAQPSQDGPDAPVVAQYFAELRGTK
jgi:hypothetical protein